MSQPFILSNLRDQIQLGMKNNINFAKCWHQHYNNGNSPKKQVTTATAVSHAFPWCIWLLSDITGFVSVDFLGEKNQVILEWRLYVTVNNISIIYVMINTCRCAAAWKFHRFFKVPVQHQHRAILSVLPCLEPSIWHNRIQTHNPRKICML